MPRTAPLRDHFVRLTALLHASEQLWRPVPFFLPVLPWESQHRALAAALDALSEDTVTALETDPAALVDWLAGYLPELAGIRELNRLAAITTVHSGYPAGFARDIPGRKWQQVTAFAACLDQVEGPVLEWCAGKAHLGRAICRRFQTPVTALEFNPDLCRQGNALSQRLGLDVRLQQCDVLAAAVAPHLSPAHHAVALHACGDLHRRLIETVTEHRLRSLDLSPCCYHLMATNRYQPYSQAGKASGLALSRDDCRLAVQETVTAPASISARRRQKSAWRLGFDSLQRQLRGVDEYLPVPSLPESAFENGFPTLCRHIARLKGLALPATVDWARFEHQGWQRQARVSRMELPRHALRRTLELWLVLDRALHLAECGYGVTVGTFCERRLTPRNLMIRASRRQRGLQ